MKIGGFVSNYTMQNDNKNLAFGLRIPNPKALIPGVSYLERDIKLSKDRKTFVYTAQKITPLPPWANWGNTVNLAKKYNPFGIIMTKYFDIPTSVQSLLNLFKKTDLKTKENNIFIA